MAKVTSKFQLTVPKAIADKYKIKPGDQLEWVPAGNVIRVIPPRTQEAESRLRSVEERLKQFHQMLDRQRQREIGPPEAEESNPADRPPKPHEIARGWRREDLYTRGGSR